MTATIPTIPQLETQLKRQRLLRLLREKQRRLDMQQQRPTLEEDLGAFFREAWKVLEPGRKLAWSWCYDLQAEYLWLVREGKLQEYFPGVVGMIDNVPPRTAKALALDTPVPTPYGRRLLGELHTGDWVFGQNGKPCRVVGESPIFTNHDCYEVEFSTGEKIVADGGHLWAVTSLSKNPQSNQHGPKKGTKFRGPRGTCNYRDRSLHRTTAHVITMEQIAASVDILDGNKRRSNHKVAVSSPVDLPDASYTIPPYVLGAWLGDGTSTSSDLTCARSDGEILLQIIAAGENVHEAEHSKAKNDLTGRFRLGPSVGSPLITRLQVRLRALGVLDNKHIPEAYFNGSTAQRLELLRGLMDTDGTIDKRDGQVSFSNTNHRLALDVKRLAASLGLKPTIRESEAKISGRYISQAWRVGFKAYAELPVFHLSRKRQWQQEHQPRGFQSHRAITSVKKYPTVPVKCLVVDSPDHLFLVSDGYIPTHNSTFWTICYPVWTWTKYPERRFQCFSYAQALSEEHSLKRRDLILSPWFQQLWGDKFKLRMDQHEKANFSNDKTGSMTASSIGGAATGKGGDTLILDDPINATQALSETERATANNWIDNTLRSRLNDPDSGLILMIMQRLNDLDPTGFVLTAERERWIWLKLPLEAEDNEEWKFPVSGRVVKRAAGEILMPDRFSATTVARLKTKRLTWSCQYQQRPAPLEGNMIKFADVRYYGGMDALTGVADPPLPTSFDLIFVSCDAAFKDLKTSDYVAIGTIGVKGPNRYVLDVVNKHLDCDATEAECKRQRERVWGNGQRASSVLIEDKANGSAVIKRLKRVIPGVVAVEPEGGKVARMFATVPEWQGNNWWVDRNAAWTELYLDQLTKFPAGAHDDMVDCTSQAAIWIQKSGVGMLQFYAEQASGQGQQPTNGNNGPAYPGQASTQINPAQHQSAQFDPWGVFR